MAIRHDFQDEEDFVRVMTLTAEGLMPLIRLLDEQEDPDKKKVSAAAFVLIFKRLIGNERRLKADVMQELGMAYDLIVSGHISGYDLSQDN